MTTYDPRTTDPVVYGTTWYAEHRTPEGATSNPGTVQAHIDRTLGQQAEQDWFKDPNWRQAELADRQDWHNDPKHNVDPTEDAEIRRSDAKALAAHLMMLAF